MSDQEQRDVAYEIEIRRIAARERISLARIALLERMIIPTAAVLVVLILYWGLEVVAEVVTSEVLKAALESQLWGILLGGAGVTYGVSVRIRFRATQRRQSREHAHTKNLEARIWPERTSSDMPYTGDSRPED